MAESKDWFLTSYGWALLVGIVVLLCLAYYYEVNEEPEPSCENIRYNMIIAEYDDGSVFRYNVREGLENVVPVNIEKNNRVHNLELVWVEDWFVVSMCS